MSDNNNNDNLEVSTDLEGLSQKSYSSKKDIIDEIAIRLFEPQYEKLLNDIIEKMMKKGDTSMTMEKYAEKNFGALICHFPDLKCVNQTLSQEKLKQRRKNRRKRRSK